MDKAVLISLTLLVAAGVAESAPAGINVLSQQHRVWGSAGSETELLPGGTEATYDETSPNPLDVSVTGTYIDPVLGEVPLTASSQAGDFQVQTDAVFFFSQANAQSVYTLDPDARVLALTLQARGEGFGVGLSEESNVRLTLNDETAGIQLEDFAAPTVWIDETTWNFAWDRTYPIDTTHVYNLTLSGLRRRRRRRTQVRSWLSICYPSSSPPPRRYSSACSAWVLFTVSGGGCDKRECTREESGGSRGAGIMQETTDKLEQAMQMIGRARHVLLATVDETGTPRLTPVEECTRTGEGRLSICAWVDVPPLENRGGQSRMTLLLLDEQGQGYQLTGHTLGSHDTAVLDGLTEIEEHTHFPQVERDILMQIESVEDFHFAAEPLPHA